MKLQAFRLTGLVLCVAVSAVGAELLDALRAGDATAVRRLVQANTPVDAKDEFGSTALMYAAMYSDVATMRLLLERGANPNQADNAGATALMWAIPDEAKVRLLIERGANVNAVSTLTGRTPLLIAAGRPGAAGIVRLLLEKNADARAKDKVGDTVLFRAALSGDPDIVKLVLDRDADINAGSQGVTPLMEAVVANNGLIADMLIAQGANINAKDGEGYTALTSAVAFADPTLFRRLIDKGADPKLRSMNGGDLLMATAASDSARPELIRYLVKLGLDPKARLANLHTQHGYAKETESPLDWASRHGDTPVARALAELTGESTRNEPPVVRPRLSTKPRGAIEKALPLLYEGGREFFKRSGCTSCHHNMLPSLAFSLARRRGIVVDQEKVRRNYLQSAAWVKGNQESFFQDTRLPGGDTTAAYLLWGLESDGHRRDRATDSMVHHLAGAQSLDGGFRVRADRPPIESSRATPTAIAIRAMRAYPIPGRKEEFDGRIQRAAKWLADYSPRTGEDRAMRLLGLVWAGADARIIRTAASQLASAQRPDGGWAQLDTLSSDAYATGQALFALYTSGRLSSRPLERGVRFLLDTQLADGSWHVRSRAYPLQSKYFDTGFPHGRDQWISAAGTSWACVGLSIALQ